MAAIGVACHAIPRWLMTPLAASPASFQPSKAAMATGELSFPSRSNSMAPPSSQIDSAEYWLVAPAYVADDPGSIMSRKARRQR